MENAGRQGDPVSLLRYFAGIGLFEVQYGKLR